jgi:hypothetical protein
MEFDGVAKGWVLWRKNVVSPPVSDGDAKAPRVEKEPRDLIKATFADHRRKRKTL